MPEFSPDLPHENLDRTGPIEPQPDGTLRLDYAKTDGLGPALVSDEVRGVTSRGKSSVGDLHEGLAQESPYEVQFVEEGPTPDMESGDSAAHYLTPMRGLGRVYELAKEIAPSSINTAPANNQGNDQPETPDPESPEPEHLTAEEMGEPEIHQSASSSSDRGGDEPPEEPPASEIGGEPGEDDEVEEPPGPDEIPQIDDVQITLLEPATAEAAEAEATMSDERKADIRDRKSVV